MKFSKFLPIVALLTLSACQMGQDAVVVQSNNSGDQKCWFLHDQDVRHGTNGAVRWRRASMAPWNFNPVSSVRGNTDFVHSSEHFEFSEQDFIDISKNMGVTDPSKCVSIH